MGRGNVCTLGKYEGLWYIDYDKFCDYNREDEDEDAPEAVMWQDDFIEYLQQEMMSRYKSFEVVDRWVSDCGCRCDKHAILESKLFFVAIEDNQWSLAIELIQRVPEELAGLQAKHYEGYLETIKNIILDLFGEVSYRNGAWMSGTIRKEDIENEKK